MTPRAATLILIRHGRTAWNEQERFQGQSDSPLDAVGREQSRLAAERLAAPGADAIYSSDLGRARESADMIARQLGLPVEISRQLRERSYGEWEGLTRQEVEAQFPESWRQWMDAPQKHRSQGCESLDEMTTRVLHFLHDLTARRGPERLVVVSHGGPIKSAVMHFVQIPMSHRGSFVIDNASLTVLALGGQQATLQMLNDTCHLGGGGGTLQGRRG